MVFGESLPGLWWVGAAGLVVGNVVIGHREEEEGDVKVQQLGDREGVDEGEERREGYRDREGEGDVDGGVSDGVELGTKTNDGIQR